MQNLCIRKAFERRTAGAHAAGRVVVRQADERRKAMVNKVMNRMNIPTRSELEELKERLAKLEQAKKAKESA